MNHEPYEELWAAEDWIVFIVVLVVIPLLALILWPAAVVLWLLRSGVSIYDRVKPESEVD